MPNSFICICPHVSCLTAGGILQQSWQENLLELEAQLARSAAQWKLVIGHHPVRRNNRPDNNMDLLPTLEPILDKHGVQAYFCGHEHNLQYLHQQNSSVHYVITGGGSLTDYTPIVHYDNGGSQFQYWGSGENMIDSFALSDCLQMHYASLVCTHGLRWLTSHILSIVLHALAQGDFTGIFLACMFRQCPYSLTSKEVTEP